MYKTRKANALLVFLASLAIASCDAAPGLHYFKTTSPGLNYLTTYTGRLAERDGCVVMVLGERMLSRSNAVRDEDSVAIPLFNPKFSIEEENGSYVIVTDDGRSVPQGTIITGEGGPYPIKPLDPRSAPVKDPPDTTACRGVPYQINSLFVSDLKRTND